MPQTAASLESDVRLPRAVRERAERIRAMTEPRDTPPADPTNPPADPAAPIVAASPSPAIEPPAQPPAPPAPAADPRHSDPAYWQQRFNVTQGMLDKERRDRLADQDRFDEQLRELREQMRTLERQQPASPSTIDITAYFTPEQIEQYGEEQCRTLAAVAARTAREQVQAAIQAEMQPIRESQANAAERDKRARQQAFVTDLAARVPDYAEVDASDGWKLWLAEDDPASGVQRQELLNRHVASGNAARVAAMFDAYKATLAVPAAPPVVPGNRAGPPAAPPVPQAAARGYPSKDEIKDFYKRAALGKVKEQERADFEARLQLRPLAA